VWCLQNDQVLVSCILGIETIDIFVSKSPSLKDHNRSLWCLWHYRRARDEVFLQFRESIGSVTAVRRRHKDRSEMSLSYTMLQNMRTARASLCAYALG
jgi:hypothetical protein